MPAYLEASRGASDERIALESTDQFTIGRHPACSLVLPDDAVSQLHAVLDHLGPSWCLSDVSAHGTVVNGSAILGSAIAIGGTSITFWEFESPVGDTDQPIQFATSRPAVTPAEQRVLVALCRPLATEGPVRAPASVALIADLLDASFETVKFHLRNLYAKFDIPEAGTDRRALLADAAVRSGAISLVDIRRE